VNPVLKPATTATALTKTLALPSAAMRAVVMGSPDKISSKGNQAMKIATMGTQSMAMIAPTPAEHLLAATDASRREKPVTMATESIRTAAGTLASWGAAVTASFGPTWSRVKTVLRAAMMGTESIQTAVLTAA
jgi:hypothetical protein